MTTRFTTNALACALGALLALPASSQDVVLRDLESKSPRKLSKDEVTQLLTGAKMSRVSGRGNQHFWTNEPGGSFVISSDNAGAGAVARGAGRTSTSLGKWHISDDGRYCIVVEWQAVPTEQWCRLVFETTDGHYTANSDATGTERAYKLVIKK